MNIDTDLTWDAAGLIPAVVQETETGEVLMVAWMDRDALHTTLATGAGHYWSRSRQAPWRKGETSGHVQHVEGVYADCDRDTLLVQVHQEGVACHTGARSCFFTRVGSSDMANGGETAGGAGGGAADAAGPAVIEVLERTIQQRKADRPAGSYVAALLGRGEPQICRKIGEEATEVITAALGGEGDARVVSEIADLWFHSRVLLGSRGIPLRRVFAELARRHGVPGRRDAEG